MRVCGHIIKFHCFYVSVGIFHDKNQPKFINVLAIFHEEIIKQDKADMFLFENSITLNW